VRLLCLFCWIRLALPGIAWTHGFRFLIGAFFFSPVTLDISSSSPMACIRFFFFLVGVSPVPVVVGADLPTGPPNGELTARATCRRDDW